jgi:hypothetical protein
MRPSVKQANLMKREEQLTQDNQSRKKFWKEMSDIKDLLNDILKLRKKEKKEASADNSGLDDELAHLYTNLCEKCIPVVTPYMAAIATHMNNLPENYHQPIDKKDLN